MEVIDEKSFILPQKDAKSAERRKARIRRWFGKKSPVGVGGAGVGRRGKVESRKLKIEIGTQQPDAEMELPECRRRGDL
jgi:hypothetical protein